MNEHTASTPDLDDPYLQVADICRIAKLSTHIVRKRIRELGVAELFGGRWRISRRLLAERWPTIARELEVAAEMGRAVRPVVPKNPQPKKPAKGTQGQALRCCATLDDGARCRSTALDGRTVSAAA